MKIIKVNDYEELSVKAAQIVAEKLKQLKQPILGLATGSTPIKTYENLVEKYRQSEISFANAITFNLDEYVGLSKEDPMSYHYFMDYHLFKHVGIKPKTSICLTGWRKIWKKNVKIMKK